MSDDITLSSTSDDGAEPAASDATQPADGTIASAPVATPPVPPPGSMFRPTMHDGSSASETAGRTVPERPLETLPDGPTAGEIAPSDGVADQALILGPPDGEDAGTGGDPVAEAADGPTAPTLAADLIDGTNLFGDRAATWSGNPSEVGVDYGVDPAHAEICLCDQASLVPDPEVPDLAS